MPAASCGDDYMTSILGWSSITKSPRAAYCLFRNYYICNDCPYEWELESPVCDALAFCPSCDEPYEPYSSEEIGDE
jgi:hypothetical protein